MVEKKIVCRFWFLLCLGAQMGQPHVFLHYIYCVLLHRMIMIRTEDSMTMPLDMSDLSLHSSTRNHGFLQIPPHFFFDYHKYYYLYPNSPSRALRTTLWISLLRRSLFFPSLCVYIASPRLPDSAPLLSISA